MMSASSLPVETWLAILNHATYTPQSLPPDIYSSNYFDSVASWNQPWVIERSLVLKQAVVRTCRLWRALATPLLYECLVLSKPAHVSLLLRTLLAHQPSGGRPLGSWTKRLDVAFLHAGERRFGREKVEALLPELLRLLPNLTVLQVETISIHAWRDAATDALIDTCAQSLQVVRWSTIGFDICPEGLLRLLRAVTNLRILAPGPSFELMSKSQWESTPVLHVDSLTALDLLFLDRVVDWFTDMHLPALREVHLGNLSSFTASSSTPCHRFLHVHGQHLTRVKLGAEWTQGTLDFVRDVCPRLQILEFDLPWDWRPKDWEHLVFPPVPEMWLNCAAEAVSLLDVGEPVRFFLKYLASVSELHLKAIRLVNDKHVARLKLEHPQLLADWRAQAPIPLFDQRGSEVLPPSPRRAWWDAESHRLGDGRGPPVWRGLSAEKQMNM